MFNTSYWVFDGTVGPKWSKNILEYGFRFATCTSSCRLFQIYNTDTAIINVTVSHAASIAPSSSTLGSAKKDVATYFIATNDSTKSVSNVTFSHCFVDGWSNAMWATSAGLPMNNWLVEYNVILNGWSSAANHGEDINNNYGYLNNLTIRNNWFENRTTGTEVSFV